MTASPARTSGAADLRTRGETLGRYAARRTWTVWTITRLICLIAVFASVRTGWVGLGGLANDTTRLYLGAHDQLLAGQVPYRDFPFEYPPGVLPFLLLPGVDVSPQTFLGVYVAQMLALDASVLALLRRSRTPTSAQAAALWTVGGALTLGLWLCRNDLPACLLVVAGGLALAEGRSLRATGLWTLGVVAKVWPLALVGVLVAGARGRWRSAGAALALSGAGVLLPVWALGAGRWLWSDLVGYHGGRGVEIEATAALPTLLWHGLTGGEVRLSQDHGSSNIAGTVGLGRVCTVLGVLALLALLGYLAAGRRRTAGWDADALLLAGALAVVVSLLPAKVFSAQYVAWLLAVACVGRARGVVTGPDAALVGAVVGLTTLIYPLDFAGLGEPGILGLVPALLLLVRAGILLALAVRWARALHHRRPRP